jgi:hypothetical protein
MKKIMVMVFALFSLNALADVQPPKYCTSDDLKAIGEAFVEMDATGFDQARYNLNIGVQGGDCLNAYSLEKSAGLPHPMNMPMPSCGIVFILDEEEQQSQAEWILSEVGKTYKTISGQVINVCSKVSVIGPNPGVTIHN